MGKYYTLVIACLLISPLKAQEITNGGFENWSNIFLFEAPAEWQTGNTQGGEFVTTTKVMGAPQGVYAAHMESIILQEDTAFGFILLGSIDEVPDGGVPFNTDILQLQCWLRYDIADLDSAFAIVAMWSGGDVVTKEWRFGGQQSSWLEVTLALDQQVSNVDSVAVGFASTDPFNSGYTQNGSWLEVDEVRLIAPGVNTPDLLPNHDLEDWNDMYVEEPDSWFTQNIIFVSTGYAPVAKSMDAFEGNFAVRMETFAVGANVLPSIMMNAELQQLPNGGIPYATSPGMFVGAYKFESAGPDTARIYTVFKNSGNVVGSAIEEISSSTSSWTEFSIPIVLTDMPDTMIVVLASGQSAGSVLLVDALDLTGGTVGVSVFEKHRMEPYPNPTTDRISIPDVPSGTIVTLLDMSGRILREEKVNSSGMLELSLAGLTNGSYVVQMQVKGVRTQQFVIKDQH